MGSISSWHSRLKIQCCHNCGLGHNCSLDLIPNPGVPYTSGWPKMGKTKTRACLLRRRGTTGMHSAQLPPIGQTFLSYITFQVPPECCLFLKAVQGPWPSFWVFIQHMFWVKTVTKIRHPGGHQKQGCWPQGQMKTMCASEHLTMRGVP